jgi:L-threonylcarbamoyladenylate synthase
VLNKISITTESIIKCLKEDGVVLLPTDTVYGLAASPLCPNAVKRIYDLKSRPQHQNLPIMVASIKDLKLLGLDLNVYVKKILTSSYVPGDITIALGFKNKPLVSWLEGREEVAIRIPNHKQLLSVLRKTGPLLVTSANKHGNPTTPLTVDEVLNDLNGSPDLAIDGGIVENVPSTIINCRVQPPVIERTGRILYDDLFKLLNND